MSNYLENMESTARFGVTNYEIGVYVGGISTSLNIAKMLLEKDRLKGCMQAVEMTEELFEQFEDYLDGLLEKLE